MTAKSKRASEPRRANKPLMEKRRRARINQSLAALKTLILDSAKADNTKHSKLEKADILELTVRHFQRHRSLDVKGVNHYKAGYTDCVREVQRYLDTPDAQTMTVVEPGVRQRLLRHLDNCIAEVDMDIRNAALLQPAVATTVTEDASNSRIQPPDSSTLLAEEVNNNSNISDGLMDSGKQPNKSYDGNFVLLLPEHYLQLATALGMNLRPTAAAAVETSSAGASTAAKKEAADSDESSLRAPGEKPLDYSKNNESSDMWRPW